MLNRNKNDLEPTIYKILPKLWKALGYCFKNENHSPEEKLHIANVCLVEMIETIRSAAIQQGYSYSFKEYVSFLTELEIDIEKRRNDGH